MKKIKYGLGIVLIIGGFSGMFQGSFFGGLLLSLLGILILPPISEQIKEKFSFWQGKGVRYTSYVILFFIAGGLMNKNGFASSSATIGDNTRDGVAHEEYISQVDKNVVNLSSNRKQQREKWIKELKANLVYINLVDNASTSVEYLPVLYAISEAIKNSHSEKGESVFFISDEIATEIEKSKDGEAKMNFIIPVSSLSMQMNGGLPKEIVAVFERYRDKYNLYGEANTSFFDTTGKSVKVEKAFNLSYAFGLFDSKDKKALDAIYESVQKGISQWNENSELVYENSFMALKSEYMNHLKKVYSDSPYLIDVDFEITASDLAQEYKDNEVSADEKFKGKKVAVSGTIASIGKDVLDNPYISFTGEFLQNVTCYFSDENNKIISQLSKGQKITIIGECRGLTLTNVIIQDCKISN